MNYFLLKHFLIFSFFGFVFCKANAQSSYIYLELIKAIPCKIFQNGEEVELQGKNYVVLTVQSLGEQNIEIRFGAQVYPNQNFIINTVPNAAYGYKLAKSGESSFYLLDIVNNGKIVEANSPLNIGLSTELNRLNFSNSKSKIVSAPNTGKPESGKQRKLLSKFEFAKPANRSAETKPMEFEQTTAEVKAENTKYGVVEVIRGEQKVREQKNNLQGPEIRLEEKALLTGTKTKKCPQMAFEHDVINLLEHLDRKKGDDARMILVRKKQFTGCLLSAQVMNIAERFETQYSRFTVIKILLPLVADTGNLKDADMMFHSASYKGKLKELLREK